MSFTREQWVRSVLDAIDNPNPSQDIVNWMVNWTVAEGTIISVDKYNLLNTTQPAPGSHATNSVGVQSYGNYDTGVSATAATLKNGYYVHLLSALQSNDAHSLGFGNVPLPAILNDLNVWCGSCGYGNSFASGSNARNGELFDGTYRG